MGDLTIRTEDEFIFSDAFIGCQVQKLMHKADLIRLANCADLSAARTLLMEFGYDDPKDVDADPDDVEYFIRHEQTKLYDMIFKDLPGRLEMASFLFPFDYHNIKVCLKNEILGSTPNEDQLISVGDFDWKVMVAMIRDRNYSKMRPIMAKAVQDALDIYGRSGDPQEIDLVLDKACYKDMITCAEETGSPFLLECARLEVDILNLKAFIRLKVMKRPWTFFKKVFMPGGFITEETFANGYDETLQQFAERLIDVRLQNALKEGARELEDTGHFVRIETLLDNVLIDENRKSKNYLIGIEPIAGYWFAKEIEIDNVRIILNGILIGEDPEYMQLFLRDTYFD